MFRKRELPSPRWHPRCPYADRADARGGFGAASVAAVLAAASAWRLHGEVRGGGFHRGFGVAVSA